MASESILESRLLQEARDKDERDKLFTSLYSIHRTRLRAMVQVRLDLRLQARLDPSDVLQDVFLEAARRLEEYVRSPALPLFLWLRSLTNQRILDLHRRHLLAKARDARREQRLFEAAPASSVILAERFVDSAPSPSDEAMRKEEKARIQAALDQLEETDREILSLRHFEDLTALETAQLLGIKESAAKMRYIRALKRIRQVLFDRADGEDSP